MAKIIKLLKNSSKIFKFITIFDYIEDGLGVAEAAIGSAIAEIEKTNPSFKFLDALKSVLSFVATAKEAIGAFTSIFDKSSRSGKDTDGPDASVSDTLNELSGKIKELL